MITVKTKQILEALPNIPAEGEYACVTEEGRVYTYTNKKWEPVKIKQKGKGLQVSLYDINQNIFSQLKPMTDENLRQVHAQVFKFLGDTMKNPDNDYWALICWKRNYITIFHHDDSLKQKNESEEISDVFMEIIENLGDVKDVSETSSGDALEIWITDKNNETECYLFFNYKDGVVEGIA